MSDGPLPNDITSLLRAIGPSTVSRLLRYMQHMDGHLAPVLREMLRKGLVQFDGASYSVTNPKPVASTSRLAEVLFHPHVAATQHAAFEAQMRQLRELALGRPGEDRSHLQRHVSLRTSMLRALYMQYREDLTDKHIVLLGDDDLTSLALAQLGGFASLTVLELDPKLTAFIRDRFKALGIDNVRCDVYDAHDEVPSSLRGAVDTFMCDPARRLYRVFLRRGDDLLGPRGVFYSFVNPSHSSNEIQFVFQRMAIELGFVVTDSIPGFNEYLRVSSDAFDVYPAADDADEMISFTESMIRLERGVDPAVEASSFAAIANR